MEDSVTLELVTRPDRADAPLVVLVDSDEHPLPWPSGPKGAGLCRLVVDDWNRDLSPWQAPPLVRTQPPFQGGAPETLACLTHDLLPALERAEGIRPRSRAIMGYSLGGLFALFSLIESDAFVAAAVGLGLVLRYVPPFRFLSEGFVIIISAVCGACVAAWLKPVQAGEGDA